MKKHLLASAFIGMSMLLVAAPTMAAMSMTDVLNKYGNMTLNQIAAKANQYKGMNWAAALNTVDPQKAAMVMDQMQQTLTTLQGMLTTARMYMTLRGAAPSGSTASMMKFMMGDKVWATTSSLRVRSTAGGMITGYESMGAKGTVMGGPQDMSGTTWWNVNYDDGMSGWSAETYLSK